MFVAKIIKIKSYRYSITEKLETDKFGQNKYRNVLAAKNPAFLSDVCVYNKDFYIMYNMYGEIEECNRHNVEGGDFFSRKSRVNPLPKDIRVASELEVHALRSKVMAKFNVDILD